MSKQEIKGPTSSLPGSQSRIAILSLDACEPLDLTTLCNAKWREFLPAESAPATSVVGARRFRGVPFLIGAQNGSERIIAGGGEFGLDPIRVPVARRVRNLVFAHCLRSHDENLDAGVECATYEFHLGNKSVESVPVRFRLEIGAADDPWGMHPLLAWTDRSDGLQPRYAGRWADAGARQIEVQGGLGARHFYLWVWTNRRPHTEVEWVVIRPTERVLAIGGVTAWYLDEPIFEATARRPLRIDLPQPQDAEQPFGLEVEVDRGSATYPHPLPARSPSQFLADEVKGYGDAPNRSSSPAYVEIAATPSATVTVRLASEEIGAFRYGDLEAADQLQPSPRLRVEIVDPGRNWVRTTVVDDATGAQIPCRIHFRSQAGIPYQPHGHHSHVYSNLPTWNIDVGGDLQMGQAAYAYIDGKCEGWLPRGDVIVDVARGFEYEPLRKLIRIEPGQREVTLRLRRFTDMAAAGYYSGDTHVHFLSTQGAHLEAAGEGLNVVNLLMSQWGHLFTSMEEFTGRPSISQEGNTIVYVGQENRQHSLGHLALLGLTGPIMPWCSDGPDEAELGGSLETTLARWADSCHEQGGTVVVPHFPAPECELPALVTTGRADAVEWIGQFPRQHREYYRYLNLGYRVPLAGGTDKMSSDVAVGLYRTYVRIPEDEPFTYENWCAGLRAGRSFTTGGPLLLLQVDGAEPGHTISLPKSGATLEVQASVRSIFPVHSLQIVMNGEVVASTDSAKGESELQLVEKVAVSAHSWIAARCGGPGYFAKRFSQRASGLEADGPWDWDRFAHTSPVYVSCGEEWQMFDPHAARPLLVLLEAGVRHVRDHSLQWAPDTVTHHHGRADHLAYLEEPFHQAIEELQGRLRGKAFPYERGPRR